MRSRKSIKKEDIYVSAHPFPDADCRTIFNLKARLDFDPAGAGVRPIVPQIDILVGAEYTEELGLYLRLEIAVLEVNPV